MYYTRQSQRQWLISLDGELTAITSEITIRGNGHTLSGNDQFRVIDVLRSGNLTINNLTITNGSVSGESGGAIAVSGTGVLHLNDSTVRDSEVTGSQSDGGGISIVGTGTSTINRSVIHGNTSGGRGAGVYVGGTANVTINRSSIYSNTSGDSGGGIAVAGNGVLTVNNSSIYSNSAVTAGGTFTVGFGTLKLNHVTSPTIGRPIPPRAS